MLELLTDSDGQPPNALCVTAVVLENIAHVLLLFARSFAGLQELVDGILLAFQAGRQIVEATEMTDPAKVAYAVKQLSREAAVGEYGGDTCLSVYN